MFTDGNYFTMALEAGNSLDDLKSKPMAEIYTYIEANRDRFVELSTKVWELAETRHQEFKSMTLLSKTFEDEGYVSLANFLR